MDRTICEMERKTIQLPKKFAPDVVAYLAHLREQGLDVTDGELMIAGMVSLWDLPPDQQIDIIRRARNYDLEKLNKRQVEGVERAVDAASKVQRASSGKSRRQGA